MRIFKLCEVCGNPKRNSSHYTDYKIYTDELYLEAECNVDCELEDEVSDEEFERLVEEEFENIMEILKTYGRYPTTGIPKYVAY